ncbi:hypothetical protein BDV98DRAFT_360706 [Pterulicium gracile]|uniref:Uncharacterized protein n=1 Tax=Pterulicium gracile TaxID=1884261 RepID=A0A5C3QRB3_9AGAR|nr:hypothetical protein BDV98DRAFT_360706 [Pterula gracilis]
MRTQAQSSTSTHWVWYIILATFRVIIFFPVTRTSPVFSKPKELQTILALLLGSDVVDGPYMPSPGRGKGGCCCYGLGGIV